MRPCIEKIYKPLQTDIFSTRQPRRNRQATENRYEKTCGERRFFTLGFKNFVQRIGQGK